MTGEPIPGPLAAEIGLVNRCLPDDELDAHVQAMAEKLRDLPRMGAKLEEKVLRSIAQYRQRTGRYLLSYVEGIAEELMETLRQVPGVEAITRATALEVAAAGVAATAAAGSFSVSNSASSCFGSTRAIRCLYGLIRAGSTPADSPARPRPERTAARSPAGRRAA